MKEKLIKALAEARDAAEAIGDADLIAVTEMALADAHSFFARKSSVFDAISSIALAPVTRKLA